MPYKPFIQKILIMILLNLRPFPLKLGQIHLQAGDHERAARCFQSAGIVDPALRKAHENSELTPAARQEIRLANATLAQHYRKSYETTMGFLRERYPADQLGRIERAFRIMSGDEPRNYAHPQHRPEFLAFPDLPPRAWFEPGEFPWAEEVRAAWPAIREELEQILPHPESFDPYIKSDPGRKGGPKTPSGTDFSALADSREWTAFYLYTSAGRDHENCARCPRTAALMDRLPLARAEDYMPEILFSVLEPGGHIIPHFGQSNIRLTVHLGIIIPHGCNIRVGDETQTWSEGELLVFDDSFEHEARNVGESQRIVLILEVWNPYLKEAEIAGLQHMFKVRAQWHRDCDPFAAAGVERRATGSIPST